MWNSWKHPTAFSFSALGVGPYHCWDKTVYAGNSVCWLEAVYHFCNPHWTVRCLSFWVLVIHSYSTHRYKHIFVCSYLWIKTNLIMKLSSQWNVKPNQSTAQQRVSHIDVILWRITEFNVENNSKMGDLEWFLKQWHNLCLLGKILEWFSNHGTYSTLFNIIVLIYLSYHKTIGCRVRSYIVLFYRSI